VSCGYQGYEFGAGYLDSTCIDGWLYDADNCDADGNLYGNEGDHPCPGCQPLVAMQRYADSNLSSWDPDDGDEPRSPRYNAWHLVMDIRRNRGLKTMPFLLWLPRQLWHELDEWWRWTMRPRLLKARK
jgi:hypothetical protein